MRDPAKARTAKKLKKIEADLEKLYKQAEGDVTKAWNEYMTAQEAKIDSLKDAYGNAKDFGTAEEVKKVGKELGVARAEKALQDQYYKDMLGQTAKKLSELNKQALAYINGEMFWVYAENYNAAAATADRVGFRFDMVDEATVRRMVLDNDLELPKKTLNVKKDQRWNTKQLNSSVLQGIVNGESMDKIADRIYPIVGNNQAAAIRNARTMVTGAQNRGRLDSYYQMSNMGVVMQKVWMATPDERTRESHLAMDGEGVPTDFQFSNGLMYPGDPNGPPEEVYNCRCTMTSEVMGFKKADGTVEPVTVKDFDDEHFDAIIDEGFRRDQEQKAKAAAAAAKAQQKAAASAGPFTPDAYTQDRKDNAFWAQDKPSGDAVFRPQAETGWQAATDKEKTGVYEYTGDSDDQNQPLRGYDGSWRNYTGRENIDLDRRSADLIEGTTDYINRCPLGQDTWLQRGASGGGVTSLLGIPADALNLSENEMSQLLLGKEVKDDGFFSCGSAKGQGFGGTATFYVYAPKGTKAAYVEPFSCFGHGDGRNWDGKSKQASFGREFETILQRGTSFRVTRVRKNTYGGWAFDLEVVGQDPKPLTEMGFRSIG